MVVYKQASELPAKLESLAKLVYGFRRSFEYIQDYINISGLRIWQEELSRIMQFYTEQEANLYVKRKVSAAFSVHQSKTIPIPVYPSEFADSVSFVGRLANEILLMTSPR